LIDTSTFDWAIFGALFRNSRQRVLDVFDSLDFTPAVLIYGTCRRGYSKTLFSDISNKSHGPSFVHDVVGQAPVIFWVIVQETQQKLDAAARGIHQMILVCSVKDVVHSFSMQIDYT